MRNRQYLALLVACSVVSLTAALGGCADPSSPPPSDLTSVAPNPIQISRTRLVLPMSFAASATSPQPSQTAALFEFVAANGVGPSDAVAVERGPSGLDQARAVALAASLSDAGLHPKIVERADIVGGVERIVVERYVAIAPDCPKWSNPPGPNFKNEDTQNFGCADSANLAAMVADPKDLAMGADLAPQSGDAVTRPVFNYRSGITAMPAGGAGGGSGGAPGGAGAGASGAGAGMGYGAGSPSGATGP